MKNEPRIEFTPLFNKQRKAAPLEIKQAFRDALDLFAENPNHQALRNHPLIGKYAGFRSIDVTGDWRALYRTESECIIFVEISSSSKILRRNAILLKSSLLRSHSPAWEASP
jgi:addiction module RelE/StbE family toxin